MSKTRVHPDDPAPRASPSTAPTAEDYFGRKDKAPTASIAERMREVTATLSRKSHPWYLIDPRTSTRLAQWDAAGGIALCYTALVAPFEVAFLEPSSTAANPRFVVNRIIDFFFLADMVVQLFVMYPMEVAVEVDDRKTALKKIGIIAPPKSTIEMVTSQRKIAMHYLRTWFIIDLLSVLTIIFDILPLVQEQRRARAVEESEEADGDDGGNSAVNTLRILRVLRVLRLIKLVRLIKSSRIIKRWQSSIALDFSTQTVLSCLFSYLLAGHWFACLLMLTTTFADTPLYSWLGAKGYCIRAENPSDPNDPHFHHGPTWELQEPPVEPSLAYLDDVWCVSTWDKWTRTYYWMMMLISGAAGGDTDLIMIQSGEAIVFTFLTIASCLLMSQIIASFCDVLTNMNPENTQFRNNMDHLNRYCRMNKLAHATRRSLREYLYRAKHIQIGHSQRELVLLMSPKLQGELSLQVNGPWLTHVSFLKGIEVQCSVRIALALEPMVFVPTELLSADSMYHLSKGTVVQSGSVLVGGSVWGEDCVLSRTDLRSRPARALTYADVTRVQRDTLLEIVKSTYVGVDEKGKPLTCYEFPIAAGKMRWSAFFIGLVREAKAIKRREAGLDEDGLDNWTKVLASLDKEMTRS